MNNSHKKFHLGENYPPTRYMDEQRGDDDKGDGSFERPFRTKKAAIQSLPDGYGIVRWDSVLIYPDEKRIYDNL